MKYLFNNSFALIRKKNNGEAQLVVKDNGNFVFYESFYDFTGASIITRETYHLFKNWASPLRKETISGSRYYPIML